MNDDLHANGPALLLLTGTDDRLRMHSLLAYVNCTPTKTGVSFRIPDLAQPSLDRRATALTSMLETERPRFELAAWIRDWI